MNKPLTNIERTKYESMWQVPEYGVNSPGEQRASMFGRIADPRCGNTLIDFGCGKGKGGLILNNLYGLRITFLDLVSVGNVPEPHIEQSLWQPIEGAWDYGYCCDVMEHLPKEFTMLAVKNMLSVCSSVFFSIAFRPDVCGPKHINSALHLTVEKFTWWRDRFEEVGTLLDARDLLGQGVFYVKS